MTKNIVLDLAIEGVMWYNEGTKYGYAPICTINTSGGPTIRIGASYHMITLPFCAQNDKTPVTFPLTTSYREEVRG